VTAAYTTCGTEGSDTWSIHSANPGTVFTFFGGAGDDSVCVMPGLDVVVIFYGGDGNDTVGTCDVSTRQTRAPASGSDRTTASGSAAARVISFGEGGNDVLVGGSAADRLVGGEGVDVLQGFAGNDRLSGGAEADRLSGGGGADRLKGGPGNDSCLGGGGSDTKKSC
jgi:Ca2+-binding RTX toxin-like protein